MDQSEHKQNVSVEEAYKLNAKHKHTQIPTDKMKDTATLKHTKFAHTERQSQKNHIIQCTQIKSNYIHIHKY